MILLSLTLAVLAAWGLVPRSAAAVLDARLATKEARMAGKPESGLRQAALGVVVVIIIGVTGLLSGGRSAAVVMAAGTAVATGWRMATSHARMRAALAARRSVTEACATLAAQVRVGRPPPEALIMAAEECQILRPARSAQLLGGDVVAVWQAQSVRRGHGGLAELARAWQISTRIGAPMAAALERVAEGMAAEESVRAVVASELAGPRATGKIMAFLPVVGLALGYALGGDPIAFLLESRIGWTCLIGGVGLAAAGVLWVESLAQRAAVEG
jgi:tight adherence protein B